MEVTAWLLSLVRSIDRQARLRTGQMKPDLPKLHRRRMTGSSRLLEPRRMQADGTILLLATWMKLRRTILASSGALAIGTAHLLSRTSPRHSRHSRQLQEQTRRRGQSSRFVFLASNLDKIFTTRSMNNPVRALSHPSISALHGRLLL